MIESPESVFNIWIPNDLLWLMAGKAVEASGHTFLKDIAAYIRVPVQTLTGERPFKHYESFLKFCKLSGFDADQVLEKCSYTTRIRVQTGSSEMK